MTRRAPTGIECTCRVFSGGLTASPSRPIVLFISVNDSFTLAADAIAADALPFNRTARGLDAGHSPP